jgi:thymidine kinase
MVYNNRIMSLKLFIGCVFAGKTSRLIEEYKKWQKMNKKVICINSIDDNVHEKEFDENDHNEYAISHNFDKIPSIKTALLNDINYLDIRCVDVIFINEGQFFPDIVDFCKKWEHKNIVVCGLDGDFNRKPMGKINDLIPLCDSVTKLTAFCIKCENGTPALFSYNPLSGINKEQIQIGTHFMPVCRKCYNNLTTINELEY